MKVLIDGDGCPVVDIAIQVSKSYGIPCLLLCDTAHEFCREGAQTLVVDQGADSVDFALVSRVCAGDIVITQDYGLASLCLARNARVLHQDGWEYTQHNIDGLLLLRHESRKLRSAGGRMKGPKKRSKSQNEAFRNALVKILQTVVQG